MFKRSGVRIIAILFLVILFAGAGFIGGVLTDRFLMPPMIAEASAQSPSSELGLVEQAYRIIDQHYVGRSAVDQTQLEYAAISGMVDALGDTGHSRFLDPEMVKEQQNFTQGTFEGIGAEVTTKDGHVVIVAPIDGSPAQAAGVKPGEIIARVDGVDMAGLPIHDVVSKVLGPAGTLVTITFQDPQTGATRDLTITRAKINLQNVTWSMLPGTNIAHLRITAFSQDVTKDLIAALKQIQAQAATGIILDLRNNPGGLLDEAIGVGSQFLSDGNVLLVRDAQGQEQAIPVKPGGLAVNIPIVVLVNQGTASAAEIVAGAIQDANRGTLLGDTTFGTGTVLNHFSLSDGSDILLATEEWLTPSGRTIWHQGIVPDENVSLPADGYPLFPAMEKALTASQLHESLDVQLLRAMDILVKSGK